MLELLDYASPKAVPPPSFLRVLIRRIGRLLVRDPWMAVLAGLQFEVAIQIFRSAYSMDFYLYYSSMVGNRQWSLFAWCWRITEFGCQFTWASAIVPFLLMVVCFGDRLRTWVYGLYIVGWSIFLLVNALATGYLYSQLSGVWRACAPDSITNGWTAAFLLNPAYCFLLMRLVTPGVRFAGRSPLSTHKLL